MALYYTLPIYKDTYRLILLLFRLTKDFPREYKFTLGQDIKQDAMQLVRHIYRANSSSDKKSHLEHFKDDFEIIKLQIRLCYDMRLIATKHLSEVIELSESIGKQASGWSRVTSPRE